MHIICELDGAIDYNNNDHGNMFGMAIGYNSDHSNMRARCGPRITVITVIYVLDVVLV
jgi:hypothetical protein